jgi:hypothetical protein
MQTPTNREERALSELRRLKKQLDEKVITQKEFDEKRKPLLKELVAGSDLAQPQDVLPPSPFDKPELSSGVVAGGLPNENAIRHEYCPLTKKWTTTPFTCRIEERPFAKGAMRVVHRLYDVTATGLDSCFVVKFAIAHDSPKEHYFRDVQMQMEARVWAQRYNERCPPKAVDFIAAYVLELAVYSHFIPLQFFANPSPLLRARSGSAIEQYRPCRYASPVAARSVVLSLAVAPPRGEAGRHAGNGTHPVGMPSLAQNVHVHSFTVFRF